MIFNPPKVDGKDDETGKFQIKDPKLSLGNYELTKNYQISSNIIIYGILGEDLIQREDDKPESVRNRLEVFSKNTKPVLDFYRDMGILKDFHGTESKKIWPHVETHLNEISK